MGSFGVFEDKEQRFPFNQEEFNLDNDNKFLWFFSREKAQSPRKIFHVDVTLPNGEVINLEKPQKDIVVRQKFNFRYNGTHTIKMSIGSDTETRQVTFFNGEAQTALALPFENAVKISCSNPRAIFQDVSGQCWATAGKQKKRLDITIKSFLPGAIQRLQTDTKIDEIFSVIFNFLPLGWTIEEIRVSGNVLSITFVEEGSPALLPALAPLVAALWPLLVLIGIVVLGWRLFDVIIAKEESKQVSDKTEIAEHIESNKDELIGKVTQLLEEDLITDKQATDLIKTILEGDINSLIGGGLPGGSNLIIAVAIGGALLIGLFLLNKK